MTQTVEFNYGDMEYPITVVFQYQPKEEKVYNYGDGTGYPGCEEEVEEINNITYRGNDVTDLLESFGVMDNEDFNKKILEEYQNQNNHE